MTARYLTGAFALAWLLSARPAALRAAAGPQTEQKLKEQRAFIIQLLELDRQRIDLMLKYLRDNPGEPLPPQAAPSSAPAPASAPPSAPARAQGVGVASGALAGRVTVAGGRPDEIYVYVKNVRGPLARGRTAEISQREKRFTPDVLVVQRGTRVSFPNLDAVYHNVFSPSPVHPFDLGTYRAREAARAVTLTEPGVVDVFCNIHSAMRASILVVPNALWTRVRPDGTFRIERVPAGRREVVAWSPRTAPAVQTIDVGPDGASVTFAVETIAVPSHPDKHGQPYRSYE